jgi:NAD/NADP transhydrogenase alpha subunit
VEKHIAALAEELGMGKDSDLAVAIAEVVREHVPPASLSALSASAQETGGSRVVDALLGQQQSATAAGAGKVAETLGKVVGMDDTPGADLD